MPDAEDLISFSDATEDKDCGRTTLYRAANDGRLNTVEIGGRRLIVQDQKYDEFEPNWVGRRASKDDKSNDSE